MQHGEIGLEERAVGDVERDRVALRRVPAEGGGHRLVRLLVRADPVGGVDVEGDPQAVLVEPREELRGVGEQVAVPGVARPPAPELGVDVDDVPVHVDDAHRERHALRLEALDQRLVRRRRVRVVPAPPVAEREPWEQRLGPGDGVERAQRLGVVGPVREHVQVLAPARRRRPIPRAALRRARRHPAVVGEEHRGGVVDQGEARPRDDAGLERDGAVGLVEGAGRAAERGHPGDRPVRVAELLPVAPHRVVDRDPALDGDGEAARAEGPTVVDEPEPVGHDLEVRAVVEHAELRDGEVPAHREGGGAVLEDAVLGVLEPHEPVREDGDAVPVTLDDGARVGDRVRREGGEAAGVVGHGSSVSSSDG